MRVWLVRLSLMCALFAAMAVPSAQASTWIDYATVSMTDPTTPKLTANRLCYTDGTDLLCDAAAGLLITSGTVQFGTISATNISATSLYVNGQPITGNASGDRITSGTATAIANQLTGYISLTTGLTTWGYLGSSATYLPTLNAANVSTTNISATMGQFAATTVGAMAGGGGNYIVSGTTQVSTSSSGSITFVTGGVERMRINSSGKVGIGTGAAFPLAPLTVGSQDSWRGMEYYAYYSGAGQYSGLIFSQARGSEVAPAATQSGDVLSMIRFNGYGASNFVTGAQIQAFAQSTFTNSSSPAVLGFYTTPVGSNVIQERMRIEANGNVGIGTAAPSQKLEVSGTVLATTLAQTGQILNVRPTSDMGPGYSVDANLVFGNLSSGKFVQLYWDGVASQFVLSRNLRIIGSGTDCTIGGGTGATNCTSDQRLKKDIAEIPNALDKVAALKGVTFHWKDPKKDGTEHMGVIAQDVEKVFPQAVGVISNTALGTAKTVDIAVLVAPLIEAVKELNTTNKNLQSSLNAAHQSITELRTEFETYKKAHP